MNNIFIYFQLGCIFIGLLLLFIRVMNAERHIANLLETLRQHGIYHD